MYLDEWLAMSFGTARICGVGGVGREEDGSLQQRVRQPGSCHPGLASHVLQCTAREQGVTTYKKSQQERYQGNERLQACRPPAIIDATA